ncbi:MAG: energy transducer TonB, partial [Burkholderiales bacterium]
MRKSILTCLTIAAAGLTIVGCGSVPQQADVNTPTLLAPAVAPTYPLAARQLGEQGTTVLRITVDAIGRVSAASVVTPSGSPRLDTAALEAVQKWRYAPAVRNGLPVTTELDVPVTFAM